MRQKRKGEALSLVHVPKLPKPSWNHLGSNGRLILSGEVVCRNVDRIPAFIHGTQKLSDENGLDKFLA